METDELNPPNPAKSRRFSLRRLARFNLRFFLIAIAIFCLSTSILVYRSSDQKRAVAAIRDFGGWVRYDFQFVDGDFDNQRESWVPELLMEKLGIDFFHSVKEINLVYSNDQGGRQDNDNIKPAPLDQLQRLPGLERLYLHQTQATDDNLIHVGKLKRLKTFYVWDAFSVSDIGVAHLARLKNLEQIHLTKSKITDESLRVFGKMPKLKRLTLQFNELSDQGVKHLAQLDELESLWICGKKADTEFEDENDNREGSHSDNQITDASLAVLGSFKNLKTLGIQATRITPQSVEEFQTKNPGCKIYFE